MWKLILIGCDTLISNRTIWSLCFCFLSLLDKMIKDIIKEQESQTLLWGSFRHFLCLQLYQIALAPPLIQGGHRWPGWDSVVFVPRTPVSHRVCKMRPPGQSMYKERGNGELLASCLI